MDKAVCFDFDGVIINSIQMQKDVFSKSYFIITGKRADEEVLNEFLHNSGESLPNIFKKMNLPLEMVDLYRTISMKQIENLKIYPHMKELLEYLNNKGICCGLCTGKDRERTVQILNKLNILCYFREIVCSDDVKNPKPHPESLLLLMKKMDIFPHNVIMVGDSSNDIKCAKSAGVLAVGVSWGSTDKECLRNEVPDYLVDKVSDLKLYINRIFRLPQKKFLINDFVVAEDMCNMQCQYCLTQTNDLKKNEKERMLSDLAYREGTKFQKNLDTIQEKILDNLDIAILKISGGEILMLPNICDYILAQAKRYKGVQVLTNGVFLNNSLLEKFKKAGNICLQVSIDHHTLAGNRYRTKNSKILSRILNNIDNAYKLGVSVEINCVLTDINTGILSSFLNYLKRYEKGVLVYPFPVRGRDKDFYYPRKEQILEIEKILENYHMYKNILPPQIYMEYLVDFLKSGQRRIRCTLPFMAIGVFDNGMVTPCPNYWFKSFGSVLDLPQKVIDKVGETNFYSILLCSKNPLKECNVCFTPWELLNLYVEDKISFKELKKSPLYAFAGVEEYIVEIKRMIKKRERIKNE